VIALNGYCNRVCDEELCETTALGTKSTVDNEADAAAAAAPDVECQWQPEMDVIYDVNESPPISLCLLLGFQVCWQQKA